MNRRIERINTLFGVLLIISVGLISSFNVRLPGSVAINDWFKGKVAGQVESHYDDDFPAKDWVTNFWAMLNYQLFEDGRDGVVVGKQEWLYSKEEYEWPLEAKQNLTNNLQLADNIRRHLSAADIALYMVLVPEKVDVYPEYVRLPSMHRSYNLHQQVVEGLQAKKLDFVDPLVALRSAASVQQTFMRTDTHWTPYGATVVAKQVARAFPSLSGVQKYTTEVKEINSYRGDLLKFISVEPYFTEYGPKAEQLEQLKTERIEEGDGDVRGLFDDEEAVKVALVGTSYSANESWNFGGALKQSLGNDIFSLAKEGKGPFVPLLELIESGELSDLGVQEIIWEVPVRYFIQALPSNHVNLFNS